MTEPDVILPVAVMAILRHDETVLGVADRLGVTEAEVERWKDIFVIAGTLALREFRGHPKHLGFAAEECTFDGIVADTTDPPIHTTRSPARPHHRD